MIVIMFDALFTAISGNVQTRRVLATGDVVFVRNQAVEKVFSVLQGSIHLTRVHEDGRVIVIHRAIAPCILAEASVNANRYHCDAQAVEPTTLGEIPIERFRSLVTADARIAAQWTAYLCRELHAARSRAEILSRRNVSDRLDGWLALGDNTLPVRGNWKAIAGEIGVSPEALYREIAKRRRQSDLG